MDYVARGARVNAARCPMATAACLSRYGIDLSRDGGNIGCGGLGIVLRSVRDIDRDGANVRLPSALVLSSPAHKLQQANAIVAGR
jgi:hypothetical protein